VSCTHNVPFLCVNIRRNQICKISVDTQFETIRMQQNKNCPHVKWTSIGSVEQETLEFYGTKGSNASRKTLRVGKAQEIGVKS
jgi:hypothetical protein